MGTIPIRVAGLNGAEVAVLAHVGLAVGSFVNGSVAVIVLSVAFFHLAVGDAPENGIATWCGFAVERRGA